MTKVPFIKNIKSNMEVFSIGELPYVPQVVLIHDFLDKEECDRIIDVGKSIDGIQATLIDNDGEQKLDKSFRDCTYRQPGNHLFPTLLNSICLETDWHPKNVEKFSLIHYPEGGFVKKHQDWYSVLVGENRQRTGTFVTYLEEPEKGGETILPLMDISIKPKKGDSLFFNYVPHETIKTLHASSRIIKGEKWIITSWLQEELND